LPIRSSITAPAFVVRMPIVRAHLRSDAEMHEHALHGFAKVLPDTLARRIVRRTGPRVKLHRRAPPRGLPGFRHGGYTPAAMPPPRRHP
jgi:hypothetical protein